MQDWTAEIKFGLRLNFGLNFDFSSKLDLDFGINGGGTDPMYHLLGNVISATVGLVCINMQPEYELPSSTRFSSTRFGQFRKFGKFGVGSSSSPATPKIVSARGPSSCSWLTCASDLTFLALYQLQRYKRFPQIGGP